MMPITLGGTFFADSTTELERGEQEVYSVIALAAPGWDVDWELVIEVISAGAESWSTAVLPGASPSPSSRRVSSSRPWPAPSR